MKPSVPDGLRVEYIYGEAFRTPSGRTLHRPHRRVVAVLFDGERIVGVGAALAKEGPTADEAQRGSCHYDQFSRKIGRDIALGRAVAAYYAWRESEAEVAA